MAKKDSGARLSGAKTAHFLSPYFQAGETLRTGTVDASNYKSDFYYPPLPVCLYRITESFALFFSFAAVIVVCRHFERNLGTIIR